MEQDLCAKKFFSSNERYADLINGLACQGRQVVKSEDLQELDTQAGTWRLRGSRRNRRRSGIRDLLRKAAFGINFAVVGIENQEEIDYALPLRVLSYDVGEYERQAAEIRRTIREERKGVELAAGEYLYGFLKESRLRPTVTFVLYYGKKEWDASRALHEILDFYGIPEELRELVQNYRIQVVEVRRIADTSVFRTDVRQVFDFIRCSHDSEKLKELVEGDLAYQAMEEDAYEMAASYAQAGRLVQMKNEYRKEGKVNMCEGLEALIAEGRESGRKEGREQGRRQGEEIFAMLTERLLADSRVEDLRRAAKDREFREKLYEEYHLR